MKFLIGLLFVLLAINSALAIPTHKRLLELSKDLNIKTSESGGCLYTRTALHTIQLNKIFNSQVSNVVEHLVGVPTAGYWNCIFLKRNFQRDSRSFYMSYSDFMEKYSLAENKLVKVYGKIKYVGFVRKKYNYDIEVVNGVVTAKVRVFFNLERRLRRDNPNMILRKMSEKFKYAQMQWNNGSYNNRFRFDFKVVRNIQDAHFVVTLKGKDTRGPYDTRWSLRWSARTVSHELGHMMGLDDEYDQMRVSLFSRKNYYSTINATKCDMGSIMCDSYGGHIRKWHIYTIFKRFFQ